MVTDNKYTITCLEDKVETSMSCNYEEDDTEHKTFCRAISTLFAGTAGLTGLLATFEIPQFNPADIEFSPNYFNAATVFFGTILAGYAGYHFRAVKDAIKKPIKMVSAAIRKFLGRCLQYDSDKPMPRATKMAIRNYSLLFFGGLLAISIAGKRDSRFQPLVDPLKPVVAITARLKEALDDNSEVFCGNILYLKDAITTGSTSTNPLAREFSVYKRHTDRQTDAARFVWRTFDSLCLGSYCGSTPVYLSLYTRNSGYVYQDTGETKTLIGTVVLGNSDTLYLGHREQVPKEDYPELQLHYSGTNAVQIKTPSNVVLGHAKLKIARFTISENKFGTPIENIVVSHRGIFQNSFKKHNRHPTTDDVLDSFTIQFARIKNGKAVYYERSVDGKEKEIAGDNVNGLLSELDLYPNLSLYE